MNNLLHKRTRLNRKPSLFKRNIKFWKMYLSIVIITAIVAYIILLGTIQFAKQIFSMEVYAPTHKVYAQEVIPTPTEKEQIDAYITEVFGDDSDKAFKLLSCENNAHNPNAVNTAGNIPEGSRDTGVFQINEHWQRTQYKFLLNWKVNVEIAHQLYEENGKSFKLWTCGRRFGI